MLRDVIWLWVRIRSSWLDESLEGEHAHVFESLVGNNHDNRLKWYATIVDYSQCPVG